MYNVYQRNYFLTILKVKTIDCYQIGRHVQDGGKEEPLGDLGSANLRQDLQNKNI